MSRAPRILALTLYFVAAALALASRFYPVLATPAAAGAGLALLLAWLAAEDARLRAAAGALAVGVVAVWFARRPPWTPETGTIVWAGAVALAFAGALRGTTWRVGDAANAAIGLLAALFAGAAAANAGAGSPVAIAAAVVAGRLAASTLLASATLGDGLAWLAAAGLPFAGGPWGLAALAAEGAALGAFRARQRDLAERGVWALTGLAAALGAVLAR